MFIYALQLFLVGFLYIFLVIMLCLYVPRDKCSAGLIGSEVFEWKVPMPEHLSARH